MRERRSLILFLLVFRVNAQDKATCTVYGGKNSFSGANTDCGGIEATLWLPQSAEEAMTYR